MNSAVHLPLAFSPQFGLVRLKPSIGRPPVSLARLDHGLKNHLFVALQQPLYTND